MLKTLETIPASFFSRDGKRLSFIAYAFLALLCVGFFTPGIVTLPPTDRDESSFAQASKQMIETGNYTDIRLQEKPRYNKPIGIYWMQSAFVRVLSPQHLDQIWAYRVPSFIGATVAVLMTAAIGALLFSPAAGLLAAIMLAGCVLLNVEARLAKTDAALLACIMVAMYALAYAYKNSTLGKVSKWVIPIIFWTAIAKGVLIKGPIILMPIIGVLAWLRVSDKKIAFFNKLRPVLGIVYTLALIAPWFIAIYIQSHGTFVQSSAGNDMLAKLWEGQNRGAIPPGSHLMTLPLLFFPYVLFTVFAIPDIWKNRRDAAVKFCLGWIVPMWIVFEFSMTKLPHYVLPAYPALALLTAKCLLDGFPTVMEAKRRFPLVLIVGMWLVIGTGFAFLFSLLPYIADGNLEFPQIAAGIVLIVAQSVALAVFLKGKTASLVILTIGELLFLSTTIGYTLPRLQSVWMSRSIVQAVADAGLCVRSQVVSVGYHEPSLAFMAGTDTIMAKSGDEAALALKQNSCRVVVTDDKHKQEFIDAFANATQKPQETATVSGFNSGRGKQTTLTIFTLLPMLP